MKVIRSKSFLKTYFSIFNKKYFSNVLRNTELLWNDTDTSAFRYGADAIKKKIVPINITISYTDNFDEFRNSLVHEMLHYYVNCYVMEFDRVDWINFANMCQTRSVEDSMRAMLGSMHNSTWLMLARELNQKHSELRIKPFVGKDYENVKDLHLIKAIDYLNEKSKGKVNYICLPSARFKKLKVQLKGNQSDIPRTDFFEYELDHSNDDMSCLVETEGTSTLKKELLEFLEEIGTINKNKIKYIGTMKL